MSATVSQVLQDRQKRKDREGLIMKTMHVELSESDARYILHALRQYKEKCRGIIDDENADEDDQFNYANDLMETKLVLEELEKQAVQVFGKDVLNFSHETL